MDALGAGFRVSTEWLFGGVNLDTLKEKKKKREPDINTEDAVGHRPQFQSHRLAAW